MSGHSHYSSRHALPPIRDVLSDQFDDRAPSNSTYSFDNVRHALPSVGSSRRGVTYPSSTNANVLPPINSHSGAYSTGHATHYSSHPSSSSHLRSSSAAAYPSATHSHSQSSRDYSFDVFRPSESGLVLASSSTRPQGTLRSQRADAGRRHSQVPDSEDEDESSKKHPCSICHKRFPRPSSLKSHMYSHSPDKPFVCEQCGKAFNIQSNMRRHVRKTHGGEGGSGGDEDDATGYYSSSGVPPSSSAAYYGSSSRR